MTEDRVEILIRRLGNTVNQDILNETTKELGEIGDQRAVGPLIQLLFSAIEYSVIAGAARALGKLEKHIKDEQFERIMNGLGNEKEDSNATMALGEIRRKEAVPHIIKSLKSENLHVRGKSAEALGKIGDLMAVVPLIDSLDDEFIVVRSDAAEALGKIGDTRAVGPLMKTLRKECQRERREVWPAVGMFAIICKSIKQALCRIGDADGCLKEMQNDVLDELPKAVNEKHKLQLYDLFSEIVKKRDGLAAKEAKELKLPKLQKRKKPKRRMWRMRRSVC